MRRGNLIRYGCFILAICVPAALAVGALYFSGTTEKTSSPVVATGPETLNAPALRPAPVGPQAHAPGEEASDGPEILPESFLVADKTGPLPPAEKIGSAGSLRFSASTSSFSLHKLGPGGGPTVLVVGGIQGDEPGGFSAAALLASHYRITSGEVWVVPDLNFAGILQRNRGPYGDMNRKFAALAPTDPEYALVMRLKSILLEPQVDLILNLHDGSGWYRPEHQDALHNPKRWGQCVIIDQARMNAKRFGNLNAMARTACLDANTTLKDEEHRYHIHDTQTAAGDKEMEKTLTWFAVRNGKPAFGVEASKELGTESRTFYHLQIIESFLHQMDIGFERRFDLSPTGVSGALNSDLFLAAWNKKVVLPLDDVRPAISRVPFKKGGTPDSVATKPLLALVQEKNGWRIAYGNRTLTKVSPEPMDFDDSLEAVALQVDGKPLTADLGEVLPIHENFTVAHMPGYRVNAIGARREVNGTEAGVRLSKKDFDPRYSVDNQATTYRVEIYKGEAFAGMILVRFGTPSLTAKHPLTEKPGPESDLGF